MKHKEMLKFLKSYPQFTEEYEKTRLKMQFGREIIELRRKRGISQQELAERVNTKRNNISRVERGEQNLTIGTMYRLVNALGEKLFITASGNDVIKLSETSRNLLEKLQEKTKMSKEQIVEEALKTMYIKMLEQVDFENIWLHEEYELSEIGVG
ncbi:helix-turn-helix domain-containing protein [Pseudothermotoga elfii]